MAPAAAQRSSPSRQVRRAASVLLGLATALMCGCGGASRKAVPASGPPVAAGRPNIVFVLTDDLSWNLVPYMPHVLAMERTGAAFVNYFVTDSLCCPSRASILTGRFPHNTKVLDNS